MTIEQNKNNAEMIRQSYISVIAKAKLSLYEQRILLQLVKYGQRKIDGIAITPELKILSENFHLEEVTINIQDVFSEGTDHYEQVVKAAQNLTKRGFQYYNKRLEQVTTKWVLRVTHNRRSGQLKLLLDKTFFETLYNFKKGFCYYDLVRAMTFKHPQTIKFYQLINNMQPQGVRYKIDYLKELFAVSDKYERNNDFIRKYVEVACKELEASEEGNYFRYQVIKEDRKIVYVTLFPVKRATSLEKQQAAAGITAWLPQDYFRILIQHAHFTTRQINANKQTLEKLQKHPYGMNILLDIIQRCRKTRPTNEKGYIINAVKSELQSTAAAVKKFNAIKK